MNRKIYKPLYYTLFSIAVVFYVITMYYLMIDDQFGIVPLLIFGVFYSASYVVMSKKPSDQRKLTEF